MKAFTFKQATDVADAAGDVATHPVSMFLAGGTTLVDLMKIDVLTPDTVVDIRPLRMSSIDVSDHAITVGAGVTNSQLAWHPVVRDRFPVLSEAILSGATTQIRNMATVAGNVLQRTRCWASANTALPRIHPTCVLQWPSLMPRFTRYGPMAPRVRFRFATSTLLLATPRTSKLR